MAYEAYKAAVSMVANEVYKVWREGRDYRGTMADLCAGSNIELHHVQSKLTEIIKNGHFDRLLTR